MQVERAPRAAAYCKGCPTNRRFHNGSPIESAVSPGTSCRSVWTTTFGRKPDKTAIASNTGECRVAGRRRPVSDVRQHRQADLSARRVVVRASRAPALSSRKPIAAAQALPATVEIKGPKGDTVASGVARLPRNACTASVGQFRHRRPEANAPARILGGEVAKSAPQPPAAPLLEPAADKPEKKAGKAAEAADEQNEMAAAKAPAKREAELKGFKSTRCQGHGTCRRPSSGR